MSIMNKMPRFLLFAIFFCSVIFAEDQRIAFVLSGGGSRGLAQIGVIKALEESGIKPDLIVATSMGAVIGSLYASGYCTDTIEAIVKAINWDSFFENAAERRTMLVSQKTEPVNYLLEMRFSEDMTPLIPQAISYGQSFYNFLSARLAPPLYHAGMDFDSLEIPLRVVTTDIVSGECIVFSKGDLATAVRASCGVPLAFAPVAMDTMLLLDGGLLSNIPVQRAKDEGAEYVIAVDVTSPMWEKGDINNPVRLINQVISVGMERQKAAEKLLADVVIKPDLEGFLNTDFGNIDTLIYLGYSAAKEHMPEIMEGIEKKIGTRPKREHISHGSVNGPLRWHVKSGIPNEYLDSLNSFLFTNHGMVIDKDTLFSLLKELFRELRLPYARAEIQYSDSDSSTVFINPGIVKEIRVTGNKRTLTRMILSALNFKTGDLIEADAVDKAIDFLYATDLFKTVNIEVLPDNTVHVIVEEKDYLRARLGLRFDEFHLGEAYVQPAYENLFGTGVCAALHLQYGLRREKYSIEFQGSPLFTAYWANNIRVQGYISRERISKDSIQYRETQYFDTTLQDSAFRTDTLYEYDEMTLRKAGVLFLIGMQIGRIAMVDGGLRMERFKVHRSNVSVFQDPVGPTFREGIRILMARLTIDDLDRFPFPRKGQKHYICIGGASNIIGGTTSFLKLNGSVGYYFTLRSRHTFFPQVQFLWANKALPDVERVFLGGALPEERYRDIGVYNYIPFMGLRPRSLSGDATLLFHLMYRFLIVKNLYFRVSADWGTVWERYQLTSGNNVMGDFFREAPVGLGIGAAFQSPVGPISLTWSRIIHSGFNEVHSLKEGNVIYFSAGYDF